MTGFAGYFTQFDSLTARPLGYVNPYGPPVPQTAVAYALKDNVALWANSSFTSHQPLNLRGRSIGTNYFQREYVDDLYNRIVFTPSRMNFGTVGSTLTKSFSIWNAYFAPHTVGVIVPPGGTQGISFSGPGVGDTLTALQEKFYTATAAGAGDKTISSSITYTFDVGPSITFTLSGVRAALFSLAPNWASTYQVTREYRTTVNVSRSHKEQRRALRNRPRKVLEYQVTIFNKQVQALNRFLTKSVGYTVLVPDESRYALSTAIALSGSSTMHVAAVAPWLVIGAQVAVRGGGHFEERQIDNIVGTTITFAGTTGDEWPIGTQIMPVLSGRIKLDGYSMSMASSNAADGNITFEVTPGSEVWYDPPPADVIFNSREVFLTKPNWAQPPAVTFSRPFGTVDYGQGRIQNTNRVDFFSRAEQSLYLGLTPADVVKFENLFDRMKGMRGEFYKPTWLNDITIDVTASAGNMSVVIGGGEFADTYANDTVYRAICVMQPDQTFDFYKVNRIYLNDLTGNSTIEFTSAITRDINPATVVMICWMPVHRLASDKMTTEWATNTVAQIQLTHVTLEDLTPET